MTEVRSELGSEAESSGNVVRAVWGLLLIWTGSVVFLHWGWGLGALGAGVILLGAQAVRRYRRLEVDRFGLIAGALLLICGAGSLLEVAIDLFPLLIVAAGLGLLVSAWASRTRHGAGAGLEAHPHAKL